MKAKLKRVLALLIVLIVAFGWYVTCVGIGPIESVKEEMKFGLDINGGVYVVLEADQDDISDMSADELKQVMEQTRAVLNNRVNAMGISEATVSIEGTDRLRVEMPGVENAEEAIAQIGQTAQLSFLLADGTVALTGEDVKDAGIDTDTENGGYKIDLSFTSDGADKFAAATKQASSGQVKTNEVFEQIGIENNAVIIMLDNNIVTAPTCDQTINQASCEITRRGGGYSKEEASNTAALIKGGALPISLHDITSSVQTATIGVDALNKSIVAGAIGLGLVFVLMIFVYSILGLFADIALLLYVLLVLWIMVGMGSVLTLPGIAGIILSIGMAVDANVIIFSRIKEEIAKGKTVRVAVDQGFKNALTTVLDAQITTLIASVVLYEIGSTTVKGFALTLMIGIVVSIFTAVVITQLFIGIIAESKTFSKNKFFGVKEDGTPKKFIKKEFDFLKNRKVFYCISTGIIVLGIVFTMVRGFNYGIDFTGGTMIQLDMGKTVETTEVEKALEDYDLKDLTVVLAGAEEDQVIIKTINALDNEARQEVINTLEKEFKLDEDCVLASEEFGPTVGKELKTNAVKSIVIAAICMLIYIIFRFKSWKYGAASVAGILHDVLMVLSFYAIFHVTINNPFIAGILTVVGYSINDTIVVFDRIRENKRLHHRSQSNDEIINHSINQTIDRSIMTSLTTLVSMIALFFMVSTSIREFVLPLIVGVLVGTYSSIFLCSPLYYELNKADDTSKYVKANKSKKSKKKDNK
ncbi:MAG: protein translocase subunit SecF [Eubacteriaceae bacterium]|nr:protein translocase subunit SecF [Eubacteriaceae bacterium]